MAEQNSALEELFVDEHQMADELIKKLLLPYMGLSRSEAKVIPRAEFGKLSQANRILLYLLARHAMTKLNVPGASVESDGGAIADSALVQRKTCGEILSRLKASGLISRNEKGYFIPVHSLLRVAGELEKRA